MNTILTGENTGLQFDAPKFQSSYIKVIGVGGGGTNAVNHMYTHGIEGVDFIVCNTDDKSLDSSPVPTKIKLGKNGLGAGNIPAVARERALEVGDLIKEYLSKNTQMLFITAGMGGGTGTGAAPVIAKLAKEIQMEDDVDSILVVAIVTLPFSFEGRRRRIQAEEGINELKKHVDAILIINNDKLRDLGNMGLRDAFSKADDILLTGAKGIAEIITVKSYINIDFRDVNTVMQRSGVALMGSGIADGENRAIKAIEMATSSVLLNDNEIKGAKNILLYLSSGSEKEITMDEIGEITDFIRDETGNETDIIWGAGFDENLGEKLNVTLVATGFEAKKLDIPVVVRHGTSPFGNGGTLYPVKNETPTSTLVLNDEPEQGEKPITNVSKTDASIDFQIINKGEQFEETSSDATIETSPLSTEEFTLKTANETTPAVERNLISEEMLSLRAKRMREIREKLESPQGLEELEKTPAYQTMGHNLFESEHSSKSEVSKMSFNSENGVVQGNTFLYDNPD